MKDGFLDKLITRLDRFSPSEVQNLVSRLVREKGFMESVFEALREGVFILDPDGNITFANRAVHQLLGVDTTRCVGQKVNSVIRGLDWSNLAHPDRVVTRDMEVFYPENRFLNFYLAPINGQVESKEEHLGYVMLIHDITKSKKAHEENLETEKLNALTFLAAGVAHEIGNPLTSLDIHLQLLGRKINKLEGKEKQDLSKLLGTAKQEIKRLDNILKQFLHALRPQGSMREKVQLHNILRDTLETLEAELIERDIKINLELTENLPLMDLDAGQIQQALYNLIRNAAQAVTSKDGQITIDTKFTDHEVVISITDNGKGISPEHMGALFEPFRTTKKSGSGLGLLIVRRIVREHGGEMEIDSEENKGTTVNLYFPRMEKHIRLLETDDSKPLIDVETEE
ncbi:MAG: two-component system sensor histidine kinase NtrB [Akkermansiaceae bacterium]